MEDEGSQGIDQDGRRIWVKAVRDGARELSRAGLATECERAMAIVERFEQVTV